MDERPIFSTLILGENGTGKSFLLKTIVDIFIYISKAKYTKENPSSNIPNFVLNILLMAMNIVLKKNQGEIYFVGKMVLK